MKCPKCNFDNPADTKFCGECAAPLHPSEEISVSHTKTLETPKEEFTRGTTFAERYDFIEELGIGGMGSVYKVFDKKIKEEVALKILKPEIVDEKTIERFSSELKLARKIRHENVCQMYDINEEKGTHYITMEYVPGEDLKSFIRRVGQLPVGKTISITKQVCEGLSEAHRLGVVHRDLKPQNIMIDKEGNARIMDFGIARSIKGKGITGAGMMIGTPEYMSPEQVEGKEVDQRSDIYSLGVNLYEMVTGQVPFEGDTPFTIGMKHKSETPKNPKELNAQIPEDLSRVILRCMEKDREKRYQKAEELISELTNIEKGIPTTERVVPKRKPITSREITVTFGFKKLFIPALVTAALIIIALIIWQPWSQKQAVPIPSDKPSVAIMYFKNDTGDEELGHWRSALSQWLITDLTQSRFINVLPVDKLFSILRKLNLIEAQSYASEHLKKVAVEGGVSHIFQASLSKAGDTFRIDYSLQRADTLEIIGSDYVKGEGEESFPTMVDDLTKKIKADLKLSEEVIASDIDKEVGKITTGSPEAFKHYIEGRRYLIEGNDRQSIESMKKAVAIDPEFAMAYRSMGASYGNLGYGSEERKVLQKALELSDRASIRERYLIQGYAEKSVNKRIEAYRKLLELYPEDMIGNNNLGNVYMYLEQWDKAIERNEVNIKQKTEFWGSYGGQAEAYMAKGLYDKAKEVLEYYLNNISENVWIHLYLAENYLFQGKYNLALGETDKAFFLNPTAYHIISNKGDIYLCQGDLNRAEEEYKKLLELEEQKAHLWSRDRLGILYLLQGKFEESKDQVKQGIELAKRLGSRSHETDFHSQLAYLHLKSGNLEEALEECERAMNSIVESTWYLYDQIVQLHRKGHAYLEKRSLDEAQQTAKEIKESIEKLINKKLIRYYYHLIGMTELEKENFPKAIEYFRKAISLMPSQYSFYPEGIKFEHALFINSLALAYYKSGDLEKAREEYERITKLTTGRFFYGDIYAKSFYMLGKIHEEQGTTAKALEHYEKFLDLWKDADPDFPEVEDAKERLAALRKL